MKLAGGIVVVEEVDAAASMGLPLVSDVGFSMVVVAEKPRRLRGLLRRVPDAC